MGVYIKGMEMPTDCAMMIKIFPDGRVGVPIHLNWCGTMVVNDAEAIPVPPHGDLIDRNPFIDFIKTHWDSYDQWFVDQLEARPTVIEAEEGE